MSITHHLDASTLMSCAAGSQPEALAAVVASHLSVCAHCRAELRKHERIGEALFEGLQPTAVIKDAPVVAMRAEEAVSDVEDVAREPSSSSIPAPLRGVLGSDLGAVRWRRLAPGIWHYPLPLSPGAEGDLRLLKIAPNMTMPEHGHGGSELTLVLSGSYKDTFGTFRTGDVADLGDDLDHQPVADAHEGCVCLIATDRKARFKGFLARMVQPLTGL
ncbi:MAG: ChrR family anti-sigma-E factor [Hyphomicrobium sp.]|nr:ChrR family anti-sigma-E factor [Hyphomicrobium sp.]